MNDATSAASAVKELAALLRTAGWSALDNVQPRSQTDLLLAHPTGPLLGVGLSFGAAELHSSKVLRLARLGEELSESWRPEPVVMLLLTTNKVSNELATVAYSKDVLLSTANDWLDARVKGVRVAEAIVAIHAGGFDQLFAESELFTLENRALLAHQLRTWAISYELNTRLYDLQVNRFGGRHPSAVSTLSHIVDAAIATGQLEEAEQRLESLISIQRSEYGFAHPVTLTSRASMARIYAARGDYDRAEEALRTLSRDSNEILGADHPNSLGLEVELASLLHRKGLSRQAQMLCKDLIPRLDATFGPDDYVTLSVRYLLALTLASQGDYSQAESACLNLASDLTRVYGADHPQTLATRELLARLHAGMGREEAARLELTRLAHDYERILGAGNERSESLRREVHRSS